MIQNEVWTKDSYQKFLNNLFTYKEESFKKFNDSLIPGITNTIGIRIPILRKIAKDITMTHLKSFLDIVGNDYLEETILEGFVIAAIKDKEESLYYLNRFIPKINNWLVCDTFCNSYKIAKKYQEEYLSLFLSYLKSKNPYQIRVGLIMLLSHYKQEKYSDIILKNVQEIKIDHYYVQMAQAWLLCELYIHHKEKTLPLLLEKTLPQFVHNKTIQKIVESFRVSKDEKEYLRKLKI